eukprot:2110019-Heterocapsa_arctica.AAC.1
MGDHIPIPSFCIEHSLFHGLVEQRFAQLSGHYDLPLPSPNSAFLRDPCGMPPRPSPVRNLGSKKGLWMTGSAPS